MPSSRQLWQSRKEKHSDWKHHKLAWFLHSPGQDRKAPQIISGTHLMRIRDIGEVRCLQRPKVTNSRFWSPCCHLAKHTQVSAAAPPDDGVASSLRLWDPRHPPPPILNAPPQKRVFLVQHNLNFAVTTNKWTLNQMSASLDSKERFPLSHTAHSLQD